MAYLIIDSTDFTPGFYLVTQEIWDQVKAIQYNKRTDSVPEYNAYYKAIYFLLQSEKGLLRKGVNHYYALDTYSNLSLGAVEGVFAINGG